MEVQGTVLIVGSAPDATRCRDWPRDGIDRIVAINNAWRIRPDWDDLVVPEDFPEDRRPQVLEPGQRMIQADGFVPANNAYGGIFYAGGTMAFTAGYWALAVLRPRVLAFLGCDMIYPPTGHTHFYGTGAPDPLRADPTLRNLEAKSARLMLLAAREGTACVRLSEGESRLIFPCVARDALAGVAAGVALSATETPLVDAALAEEDRLGYRAPSGRYWESGLDVSEAAVDALDAMWLRAAGAG